MSHFYYNDRSKENCSAFGKTRQFRNRHYYFRPIRDPISDLYARALKKINITDFYAWQPLVPSHILSIDLSRWAFGQMNVSLDKTKAGTSFVDELLYPRRKRAVSGEISTLQWHGPRQSVSDSVSLLAAAFHSEPLLAKRICRRMWTREDVVGEGVRMRGIIRFEHVFDNMTLLLFL